MTSLNSIMTNPFISENFLLENKYTIELYHEYAKSLPIIDYHNHLPPNEIAMDKQFENITQIWLNGDHYKWRAMRANGVNEHYITGPASDWKNLKNGQPPYHIPYAIHCTTGHISN